VGYRQQNKIERERDLRFIQERREDGRAHSSRNPMGQGGGGKGGKIAERGPSVRRYLIKRDYRKEKEEKDGPGAIFRI